MKATSGFLTPSSTAPVPRIEPPRSEVRRELTGVVPPRELVEAPAPEECGPAPSGHLPVEKDRDPELLPHARPDPARHLCRAVEIGGDQRDDRHDIRRPDARMDAVVAPEVDPSSGLVDSGDQPALERLVLADQRDHGAVMAAVDVRVERARSGAFERGRDRGHRRRIAPFGDVGHGLEEGHPRTLRPDA